MIEIERPNITTVELKSDGSYGKFVIEPLERGYGTTLGNSLRRVLLSSLPGVAATSVKIDGVLHEISTIPNVKEDVPELILNIKGITAKLHTETPKTVILEATEEGEVTAGDIKCDADIEILNKDHHLAYVEAGGVLLTGIPQFSTHIKRDFLRDMDDLALWNGGDLAALCGIKVNAAGREFSGNWNCADREKFPEVTLSARFSSSPDEDGSCRLADITLAGAEPFIWDADSNLPLVTRFRCGKGTVYTLTAYAYAGHEKLQKVMASLIARLAGENLPECYVSDPSGEVFWNMHAESGNVRRLMLLNTDWSTEGNCKQVSVTTPEFSFSTSVAERKPKIFTIVKGKVIEADFNFHIDVVSDDTVTVYGTGKGELTVRTQNQSATIPFDLKEQTSIQVKI